MVHCANQISPIVDANAERGVFSSCSCIWQRGATVCRQSSSIIYFLVMYSTKIPRSTKCRAGGVINKQLDNHVGTQPLALIVSTNTPCIDEWFNLDVER